jgi:hypothetical protein
MTRIGNSRGVFGVTASQTAFVGQFGTAGSCYPDKKHLPNGQNAHCRVRSPDAWANLVHVVAMRHTKVSYPLDLSSKTEPPRKLWGLYGKRTLDNQAVGQWA